MTPKKVKKEGNRPKTAGRKAPKALRGSAVKDALNDLLSAGTRLSNMAYNLVQWTGELTPETKRSIDGVRQAWDINWRAYRDALDATSAKRSLSRKAKGKPSSKNRNPDFSTQREPRK